MSKRESLAQSQMLREIERLRRRMVGFEADNSAAGLTLTDFNKVKQPLILSGVIKKEVTESQALED